MKYELKRAMNLTRICDGGLRIRQELFEEAPPERPFVRHDGKASDKKDEKDEKGSNDDDEGDEDDEVDGVQEPVTPGTEPDELIAPGAVASVPLDRDAEPSRYRTVSTADNLA